MTLNTLQISKQNAGKTLLKKIFWLLVTGILYTKECFLPGVLSLLPCSAFESRWSLWLLILYKRHVYSICMLLLLVQMTSFLLSYAFCIWLFLVCSHFPSRVWHVGCARHFMGFFFIVLPSSLKQNDSKRKDKNFSSGSAQLFSPTTSLWLITLPRMISGLSYSNRNQPAVSSMC